MQTAKKDGVAAQNYTAATVNQRVLKRSVIKGYFLNHENFISADEKNKNPLSAYGRNAGAEFNYYNLKGTWEGWAAYHRSFKKTINDQNNFYDFGGKYNSPEFFCIAALWYLSAPIIIQIWALYQELKTTMQKKIR